MGICYQEKTLRDAVSEREQTFKDTGYAYGLEKLGLVEGDPAKFMRFQMRLVAACINSRESAKLISSNPMSVIQGELLFMLANPAGDVVSASYGLCGHVQAFPTMIKNIAELGFEDDPEIRDGDLFSTNDAMYGAPHNADCYTWLPIFYQDELVGWTVGLNHIVDVGGVQPGGLGTISTSVFTDGFTYPPTKTGANFKQHKWWELHWKRRTRTELFNILDDKMRVAGVVALQQRVMEIIDEFGIDYYRKGLGELVERERRVLVDRIKQLAVPGSYSYLQFKTCNYKGNFGRLWPASNRNWIFHKPADFQVRSDGTILVDVDGLSSEGEFHCNAYPSAVGMICSTGMWPMFSYTETINSSVLYMTDWNIPPGSMFNPQNPWAGTVMGLGEASGYIFAFMNCLSMAYFTRGYLEETFSQDGGCIGYGLTGVLGDGFQWAGGDMALITCIGQAGYPYRDGLSAAACTPNPATDMGEMEILEFLMPTQVNIGRKLVSDFCGHGKFRGGFGVGMLQMVNQPGQSLEIAAFSGTGGAGACALGRNGGYPGMEEVIVFVHGTNMRELLDQGHTYPRDFREILDWIKEGKLTAESIEVYNDPSPNIPMKDGDLFATAAGQRGGWGDVLERPYDLIDTDLEYGWMTSDCARTVYGAVTNGNGHVDVAASDVMRQQMRNRRKERSVDAKEWWKQERQIVIDKRWHEDIYNMFADNCRWDKSRNQFYGMWQLPGDYSL